MASKRQRPERDRPIRSRRKKSKLPLILIVLAVVAGGLYALHRSGKVDVADKMSEVARKTTKELKKLKKGASSIPSSGAKKQGTPVGKGPQEGGDPTGPDKRAPSKIDPKARDRAQSVLRDADGEINQGRFKEAQEAIDGFLETKPAIGRSQTDELRAMRKQAFQHHVLTQDYRLDGRLLGETTELKMVDQRVMEVRITSRSDDRVDFVWKGIKSSCQPEEILSERVIPASELREKDTRIFERLRGKATDSSPRAYLVVIKFCVERNMRGKIRELTTQAEREQQKAMIDRPKLRLRGFFESLFEQKASILYQRYLAFVQRGRTEQKQVLFEKIVKNYPDTAIARELGSLSRKGGDPPPVQEERKVIARLEKKLAPRQIKTSNASVRGYLKEGDRLYALAMKEFRLSFPGQPKADSHLRPAWNGFLAAQKQYQKAYELDPKMSIEDKIAICQREIYTCQKQMKIN